MILKIYILLHIFVSGLLGFSYEIKKNDINIEKKIINKAYQSVLHEDRLFDLFNDYILTTGDFDIINFKNSYDFNSSSNFLKSYNHSENIELSFDSDLNVFYLKKMAIKNNNFAYKKYIEYSRKNGSIITYFTENGNVYTKRIFKLPVDTIKFIYRISEILSEPTNVIVTKDDLATYSNPNTVNIYVPDGLGDFKYYQWNGVNAKNIGKIKTFNGIYVNDIADLNISIPKISGMIGYVVNDIEDSVNNIYKSILVEYIFDGTNWKKKINSVSEIINSNITMSDYNAVPIYKDVYSGTMINNIDFYKDGFLNNDCKIIFPNTPFINYSDPLDIYRDQNRTVIGSSILQDYNLASGIKKMGIASVTEELYSKSNPYIFYGNVLAVSIITRDYTSNVTSSTLLNNSTDGCNSGEYYNTNTQKCNSCSVGIYDTVSHKCKTSENVCSLGFSYDDSLITKKCVDLLNSSNVEYHDTSNCINGIDGYDLLDGICYNNPIETDMICNFAGGDINYNGKCLTNSTLSNLSSCNGSQTDAEEFIEDYVFNSNSDFNKYKDIGTTTSTKTKIVDSYSVCDYYQVEKKYLLKHYIYPSFKIEIPKINNFFKNIDNNGTLIYNDIILKECDSSNSCNFVLSSSNLENNINSNSDIYSDYGIILDNTKKINYIITSDNNLSLEFDSIYNKLSLPNNVITDINDVSNKYLSIETNSYKAVNNNYSARFKVTTGDVRKKPK